MDTFISSLARKKKQKKLALMQYCKTEIKAREFAVTEIMLRKIWFMQF